MHCPCNMGPVRAAGDYFGAACRPEHLRHHETDARGLRCKRSHWQHRSLAAEAWNKDQPLISTVTFELMVSAGSGIAPTSSVVNMRVVNF
jgi:hypothetical protein